MVIPCPSGLTQAWPDNRPLHNEEFASKLTRINLARIDLNLLVTIEALMGLGSVTLAAERVARTPSAVSHALDIVVNRWVTR
jgi:hypothetical protein